jgi:hypothetical protein
MRPIADFGTPGMKRRYVVDRIASAITVKPISSVARVPIMGGL